MDASWQHGVDFAELVVDVGLVGGLRREIQEGGAMMVQVHADIRTSKQEKPHGTHHNCESTDSVIEVSRTELLCGCNSVRQRCSGRFLRARLSEAPRSHHEVAKPWHYK